MPTRTLTCVRCGGGFVRTATPANLNRAKFCSRECMAATFRERTPELMDALRTRLAERSAIQPNGCILYTGQNTGSYGQIEHRRSTYLAHRAAYMVSKGGIPPRMCICHSCDTPLCINPEHLWLGSYSDNVQDMLRKGRNRYNPVTKLSPDQIQEIHAALARGEYQKSIAKRMGVGQGYVSMLKNGHRRQASKASLAAS